jgi:prophage regulatory protein
MMALLRLPQVIGRTGRSRSRIYADLRTGDFPKPVNIGPRAVAWLDTEVEEWIAARAAEREPA